MVLNRSPDGAECLFVCCFFFLLFFFFFFFFFLFFFNEFVGHYRRLSRGLLICLLEARLM